MKIPPIQFEKVEINPGTNKLKDVWTVEQGPMVFNDFTDEALLRFWLGSVNQPVVDDILFHLQNIFKNVSDNNNFDIKTCKIILKQIIYSFPEEKI